MHEHRDAVEHLPITGDARRLVADLTPFERTALRLFAMGMHRRDIATELRRAPKTISNSLTLAKEKLAARTLAEAVALFVASVDPLTR
jgi:DNA-binding CsgD family transcriptional regulator